MSLWSWLSRQGSTIGLVGLGLTSSGAVYAASCHGGGGGQTLVVLPSNQNYQIGFMTSYRGVNGHFGPTGSYSSNDPGNSTTSETVLLGLGYRLADDWQVGTTFPVVRTEHVYPQKEFSHTGWGDPVFEARYSFWDDVLFLPYRPGLEFAGGVRFPLGTSIFDSKDPYGANIVGDGTYTVHLAAIAMKRVSLFRFTLEGTYFFPLSKTVDQMKGQVVNEPYSLKSGNRFQLQEGLTVLLNSKWSASVGLKQLWQARSAVRAEIVAGSAARLFSTSVAAAFTLDPSWSFGASFETLAPFYRYAANQPNFHAMGLNASYGGF